MSLREELIPSFIPPRSPSDWVLLLLAGVAIAGAALTFVVEILDRRRERAGRGFGVVAKKKE